MSATGSLSPRQQALASALAAAKRAAADAQPGDDGGAANLDAAAFAPGDLRAAGVRKAAEAAGVRVDPINSRWWRGWWFLHVAEGQGAMRTRMAEAAFKSMQASGETASVYYQID